MSLQFENGFRASWPVLVTEEVIRYLRLSVLSSTSSGPQQTWRIARPWRAANHRAAIPCRVVSPQLNDFRVRVAVSYSRDRDSQLERCHLPLRRSLIEVRLAECDDMAPFFEISRMFNTRPMREQGAEAFFRAIQHLAAHRCSPSETPTCTHYISRAFACGKTEKR
jgi:hypothetical protein